MEALLILEILFSTEILSSDTFLLISKTIKLYMQIISLQWSATKIFTKQNIAVLQKVHNFNFWFWIQVWFSLKAWFAFKALFFELNKNISENKITVEIKILKIN
jgi:hypothetical protein